ncbi:MAG: hypothetical protein JWP94_188 [Mucilaginibacter sp.]|nr:hypothetical protein [Mucilaginibacter sp.]
MYLNKSKTLYMKKIMRISKIYYWILPALVISGMGACKKYNSAGFTAGTGAPTISSVRTISKTSVDSSRTTSIITYNSSGLATTVTNPNYSPQLTAFDSTTVTGKLGNTYAAMGANLGSTSKILLNGVSIYFNRALISDKSVIFTIPTNIPTIGQKNTLQIVTLHGTITYNFTTLSPPPTITAVSDYDFTAGSQIALMGVSLSTVTGIKLKSTGDVVNFSIKSDTTMVLTMPAQSTVTESTLVFSYSSAGKTLQITSTVVFNDLDNGYMIFANNNFRNAWADNSWSGPSGVSTNASHSGTASAQATYPAGGWKVEGWANWYPSIPYDASYKYLTFWVKGGSAAHTLVLVGDQMKGGYGQIQNANAYAAQLITVPAKVWTFFKIPLAPPGSTNVNALNYWANGSPAKQLGFFLQGMSGDVDETMYFDEVAFIK